MSCECVAARPRREPHCALETPSAGTYRGALEAGAAIVASPTLVLVLLAARVHSVQAVLGSDVGIDEGDEERKDEEHQGQGDAAELHDGVGSGENERVDGDVWSSVGCTERWKKVEV